MNTRISGFKIPNELFFNVDLTKFIQKKIFSNFGISRYCSQKLYSVHPWESGYNSINFRQDLQLCKVIYKTNFLDPLHVLGASEVSVNLYCNTRTSVLGRLRDYLRLLMKRSVRTTKPFLPSTQKIFRRPLHKKLLVVQSPMIFIL